MNSLVSFMASPAGRIGRIIAGLGLIFWGMVNMGGDQGYIVAAIGVVPLLTGALNICLFGPLFGAPLSGAKARQ